MLLKIKAIARNDDGMGFLRRLFEFSQNYTA
jgi:hypothetical protein